GSGENIIQYDRYRALIYSQNRFGDFLVSPSLEYYKYNYLTGPDRDGRDHWQGVATLRLGYEFQPGYVVFLEPGYDLRRYDLAVDSLGLNRDSSGWQALAGLTYNVSAVTFAEAYVGYFQQDYEDAALADAGGLTYGGTLTWNPLDLLTVNASIDRSVQKSTLAGVSGTVSTSYLLGFDYEFTDSLMLTTSGIVTTSSFEGASREDFSYSAGASLVYLVNEFAQARLGSRYEARDSDLETNSYRAMIVEALLTLQY
ncbi:MAG: outer membrane beta-barrel protein, partial [Tistlia sp.]